LTGANYPTRWQQLILYVDAELTRLNPRRGCVIESDPSFAPMTEEEREQVKWINLVLLAGNKDDLEEELNPKTDKKSRHPPWTLEAFFQLPQDRVKDARALADLQLTEDQREWLGVKSKPPKEYLGSRIEALYAKAYNMMRVEQATTERGKRQLRDNRKNSPSGGDATTKRTGNTDEKIKAVLQAYRLRRPEDSMMTAFRNVITPPIGNKEDRQYLNYASSEKLLRRVKRLAAPQRPCEFYKALPRHFTT